MISNKSARSASCGRIRISTIRRRLAPSTAAVLLSLAAGPAFAVEVELLELRPARKGVSVAILGAQAFDPRTVVSKSLVLGWSRQGRDGGFVPARAYRGLRM